ncbi:proline-rich proteoglycan 2-like [Cervus elaphus]|uniref:proline-rich proteoglycan 2-like n=1 Tax=Cervus elaphus TaxID=9860 RepID=UPI001CC290F5|nr:proline-rich proteoglycan 2-like [Cervus elaphus]
MAKSGRPSPSWVPPPARLFVHWPAGRAQGPHPERPDYSGGVREGQEAPGGSDTQAPGVSGSWGVDPDWAPWRKEACAEPLPLPLVPEPQTRAPGRAAAGLPSGGGLCSPVSSTSEEEARRPRQRSVAGVFSRASSECLPQPWAPLGGHCPSSEETEVQGAAPCGYTGPSAPRPRAPHINAVRAPRRSPEERPVGSGGRQPPQTSAPSSEVLPPGLTLTRAPGAGQASPLLPGQAGVTPHSREQGGGRLDSWAGEQSLGPFPGGGGRWECPETLRPLPNTHRSCFLSGEAMGQF